MHLCVRTIAILLSENRHSATISPSQRTGIFSFFLQVLNLKCLSYRGWCVEYKWLHYYYSHFPFPTLSNRSHILIWWLNHLFLLVYMLKLWFCTFFQPAKLNRKTEKHFWLTTHSQSQFIQSFALFPSVFFKSTKIPVISVTISLSCSDLPYRNPGYGSHLKLPLPSVHLQPVN